MLTRVPASLMAPAMSRAVAAALDDTTQYTYLSYWYDGVLCHVEKDASGTALTTADGQQWKPADGMPVTPEHFGGTDETAINAAIAIGRDVQLGAKTYTCDADVTLGDSNSSVFRGRGPNLTFIDFAAGGKFEVKGCFDLILEGFTVQNGTGDNIVLGNQAGAQTFLAYFSIRNVNSLSAGGRGLVCSNAYMGDIISVRINASTGIGADFSGGHNTTLNILNSHCLGGSSIGWKLQSMSYCLFSGLGSDDNAGYAYHLQGLDACNMINCGAEDCDDAAMYLYNDPGSGDTITRFNNFRVNGFKSNNNGLTGTNGEIAHFNSTGATDSGDVTLEGLVSFSQSQEAIYIQQGVWDIRSEWHKQGITNTTKGGSFGVIEGPLDTSHGLPTNVTGASTPIASVTNKMNNPTNSFAGKIFVYASNNNMATVGQSAFYELTLIKHAGGFVINTDSAVGNTTGAAANHASFTFSFDTVNEHLEVTPVGSTATGNYYFYFTVLGNLDVTPIGN